MRPGINTLKSFRIYGKPFAVPKSENRVLVSLIYQIIGLNQYRVELIKEAGIVIDAGANMGVFSVYASVTHPHATIYAFEPTPATFETLRKNTEDYPNIKIFNCGLGEREKMASIIIAGHSGRNFIGEGGIPVEIKTVDGFHWPVDFIKIDTEGYEANILRGARETIKKYKPIIIMSAYHKPNDETALPALLNNITAYRCELRHDGEEDLICRPA